ncbi:hypothetical protein J2T55_002649 [Methylohalomonas lacus]|uniref:Cyclophilin TM1367-like domain-containing protein n=1 Tax=Methylohalomonas lacus TaxID=398773 RepID=A0AAE3HLT2_9GAMM|nr:cyclophilin-like fold protein [Methylohalomonas lacus]MCS3904609.1 hypothetical protein [Methylohalomonas lacus]
MNEPIVIEIGNVRLTVEPADTATARAIAAALPHQASISTWGDEVYFPLALECELETDARAVVSAGELAYWPAGGVIAIGFGPTPLSQGDEIRLAAPVNIWGHALLEDVHALRDVPAGSAVRMGPASGFR